jgi:hypothetical protein
MSDSTTHAKELALDVLAGRCAEETERFFSKQASQNDYCFEVLRRAIVLHSQAAWGCIHAQYRALVAGWVQKHSVFAVCDEEVDFFANGAFARFERWCTPERFARMGGLPQLLAALKACIHSEIMDYQRQHGALVVHNPLNEESEESSGVTAVAPHTTIIDLETRADFWRLIKERLQTQQENVLVEYDFVLGYKAREILVLRPDIFTDIQDIYRVRDNLIRRLRRDLALRRLFEELVGQLDN